MLEQHVHLQMRRQIGAKRFLHFEGQARRQQTCSKQVADDKRQNQHVRTVSAQIEEVRIDRWRIDIEHR